MMFKEETRCHVCGFYKTEEDAGIFYPWRPIDSQIEYISWFHNEECLEFWLAKYPGKIVHIE